MSLLDALRTGITNAANQLGISPVDLATTIAFETGGTFNPTQPGPTTKYGQHIGLIQWGQPQAQHYLNGDFSIPSQMNGIVSYMRDAGVKPGMGLLDIYSAINAGHVGRPNASDAAYGGHGTVADKVASMGPFRQKAVALLDAFPEQGTTPVYMPWQEFNVDRSAEAQAEANAMRGGSDLGVTPSAVALPSSPNSPMISPILADSGKADGLAGLLGGGRHASAPAAPQMRLQAMPRNGSPAPDLAKYIAAYIKAHMV